MRPDDDVELAFGELSDRLDLLALGLELLSRPLRSPTQIENMGFPVLGVIDQPILGERWLGVAGKGTTLRPDPG